MTALIDGPEKAGAIAAAGEPSPTTFRGLLEFSGIGPACEDNCCHSWQVPYSRADYERLEAVMGSTAEERARFAAAVQVHEPSSTSKPYASLRQVGSQCTFLTPARLCSLHMRYGEGALSSVCATYPRMASSRGDLSAVWGALSCPEVARKALLTAEAMDLVEAPARLFSSLAPLANAPRAGHSEEFSAQLARVTELVFALLSRRDLPLAARLAALVIACKRSANFHFVESEALDAERLASLFEEAAAPASVPPSPRETVPDSPGARLAIGDALGLALELPRRNTLRQLVLQILQTLGEGVTTSGGCWMPATSDFWARYVARRAAFAAADGNRVDLFLENYAKHHWCTGWDREANDLWDHVKGLLFRVCTLRFLLVSHPTLLALPPDVGSEERGLLLARATVDVVYKYTRAMNHGACGTSLRVRALANVSSLEKALALAFG